MFNETITKMKTYTDEKIQKLRSYNARQNFAEVLQEKRNTLRMTVSDWSVLEKFQEPKTRVFQKKDLEFARKLVNSSGYLNKILPIISKKSFSRKSALKYTAVFGLTAFLAHEFIPSRTKIALSYKKSPENTDLVSQLTYLNDQHFYPTPYIFGALSQSIVNLTSKISTVNYEREYLKLEDGGTIALDWANPFMKVEDGESVLSSKYMEVPSNDDTPTIFVIHGLTGGSNTGYIKSLVTRAQKKGFRIVVFNHRGVNQPLSTPFPSHGGKLDDISAAVEHIKAKLPKAKLLAVGNSLGGNQLLRYLALTGEECPFESAVTLSSPFNLNNCLEALKGSVYEKFFIRNYAKSTIMPHMSVLTELSQTHGVDLNQVLTSNSLRDFHENFTVRVFKAKDSYELFNTLTISPELIQNIKIPTLILHAKDDPIVTAKDIPKDVIASNDNIILAETARGAHICWFTGMKPKRWYPKPVVEFLEKASQKKA